MEIEKIETKERKSTLALLILTGLAIIVIVLSVRIVFEILAGGEIKVIGTMMGVALIVLAVALVVLKKGFIAEEVVTAIEGRREDTSCTEYSAKKSFSTRRTFVKGVLGISIATFFASPIVAALKFLWPLGAKVEEGIVKIAKAREVPLNSVKERWMFKGFPAILIHDEDGFRAFAVKCTHLACTASWREQYSGYERPVIFCPCHDGVFDSKTAKVLAGPPPSPLPEIRIEEKDGTIYATAWKDPAYVETLEVYKV